LSNIQLHTTEDGSTTYFNEQVGEHYHSTFGAIQESQHIFINAGLEPFFSRKSVSVFEVGFGTGLNALLTLMAAEKREVIVHYSAIELYPINRTEAARLNFPELLKMSHELFLKMHESPVMDTFMTDHFHLRKWQESFEGITLEAQNYDVVFFDAFSPEAQPEMWTTEGFIRLFKALKPGGYLVTYSCKGLVKRALKEAGFVLEKLPGPPGKREFLRAGKPMGF